VANITGNYSQTLLLTPRYCVWCVYIIRACSKYRYVTNKISTFIVYVI